MHFRDRPKSRVLKTRLEVEQAVPIPTLRLLTTTSLPHADDWLSNRPQSL
jgi:hypothetical protein